ncbi:hypothetical protein LTR16_010686, partial [Cryomyces antarcticus]
HYYVDNGAQTHPTHHDYRSNVDHTCREEARHAPLGQRAERRFGRRYRRDTRPCAGRCGEQGSSGL